MRFNTSTGGDALAILKEWLYRIVVFIAEVHDSILAYNRKLSTDFTNSELHFIVIGLLGLLLLLFTWLFFSFLTRRGKSGLMAWLFTFSTVCFITFAIEVGQHLTKTGKMELEDIVYGIMGFLAVSVPVAALYWLIRFFRWLFRKK